MEDLMSRVLYDTGSALLDFDRKEVMEKLSSFTERHGLETEIHLMGLLFSPSDESTVISSEMTSFLILAQPAWLPFGGHPAQLDLSILSLTRPEGPGR